MTASWRLWHLVLFLLACFVHEACQASASDGLEASIRKIAVYVDSGDSPMAAYQLQLDVLSEGARIVGVEGGEHIAYQAVPYYDPDALTGRRIILATYSTGSLLPVGLTRVATMHLWTTEAKPSCQVSDILAVDEQGRSIPVQGVLGGAF